MSSVISNSKLIAANPAISLSTLLRNPAQNSNAVQEEALYLQKVKALTI
jgi:hypothetical protein